MCKLIYRSAIGLIKCNWLRDNNKDIIIIRGKIINKVQLVNRQQTFVHCILFLIERGTSYEYFKWINQLSIGDVLFYLYPEDRKGTLNA